MKAMAKVKSHIAHSIRGKTANLEFRVRRNRVIELAKKRIPSNPRTEAQQEQRYHYGVCVQKYNELTIEELKVYHEKGKLYDPPLDAYRVFMKECLLTPLGPVCLFFEEWTD